MTSKAERRRRRHARNRTLKLQQHLTVLDEKALTIKLPQSPTLIQRCIARTPIKELQDANHPIYGWRPWHLVEPDQRQYFTDVSWAVINMICDNRENYSRTIYAAAERGWRYNGAAYGALSQSNEFLLRDGFCIAAIEHPEQLMHYCGDLIHQPFFTVNE